jgi:hypothetical protein
MTYAGPDDLFQAEYRTLDKHQYVHIFVVGILFAAFDAYGIGSNDVVRVPPQTRWALARPSPRTHARTSLYLHPSCARSNSTQSVGPLSPRPPARRRHGE